MTTLPALVIAGPGTNRDRDLALALQLAGANPTIVLAHELAADPKPLAAARIVGVAGGFSYGDALGAGRMLALDLMVGLGEALREYVATGSGSLHAGTVIKVGYRTALSRDDAIDLAVRSLWEAADADSATGGPDALRGIYPTVATVTAEGWQPVTDDELAARFESLAAQMRER